MKTKTLFLSVFLFILSFQLNAQKIYVTEGASIKKINITNGGCSSVNTTFCPGYYFLSIGILGSNLYFNAGNKIYKTILRNDTISACTLLDTLPSSPNSLTVDSNGIIYCASGTSLYKIDPSNPGYVYLGNMPYGSAGDLIFYKGDLYLAASQGIVKVNLNMLSQSYLYIPVNIQSLYGLASLSVDCNTNKIYAFAAGNNSTTLIELDLDNQRIVGNACTLPYLVLDAASNVENGNYAGIDIKSITIVPECNAPGKAYIQFTREPGLIEYSYTLNNSMTNTTGLFSNLNAGTYNITITTPGGCIKDTTVTVPLFIFEKPILFVHKEDPTCVESGKIWFDTGPDATLYKITLDADTFPSNHVFSDLGQGSFHFAWLEYNCPVDSMVINLKSQELCDTIFFPSAFTPNRDGKNDIFRGSPNRAISDFRLQVFSRWGQRVYYSNNIYEGWNGIYNGKEQNTGVYVWLATYITLSGKRKMQKGTVALIR